MKLSVVLVRTEHAANVGASVRALANMGGDRMILIDPRCEVDAEARALAAGAERWLDGLVIYPDWKTFYETEGDGVRLALTRRAGRKRKVYELRERLAAIEIPEHLYLIFGPEKNGLDAEDLAWVNFSCTLPTYGEFASLNLSQAVLLGCHLARERAAATVRLPETSERARPVAPFYFPDDLIKDWLTAMGFDVNARRASAYLTLRRLFLQNLPTRHEVQVLEAILQQNIRKLNSLGLTTEELRDDRGDIPGE